jgi:hypothetical protein
MTKEEEYRNYAAEAVQRAQRASLASDKDRLILLAEAWLDLLDRHRDKIRGGQDRRSVRASAQDELRTG